MFQLKEYRLQYSNWRQANAKSENKGTKKTKAATKKGTKAKATGKGKKAADKGAAADVVESDIYQELMDIQKSDPEIYKKHFKAGMLKDIKGCNQLLELIVNDPDFAPDGGPPDA